MIRVLVRQGLLGQQVEAFNLPSSAVRSARDLLDRFADAMPRHAEIDVAVNGGRLSPQQLDDPIADGDQVVLLPRTGDVVTIVVTELINVAVTAAVSYVASLLAPRPRPPGVPQDRGDDSSSTYAWNGIKTNYGPGLPIPWAYGRHALGGQVIWTDVQASRSSAQAAVDDRLRLILSLCEGPIHRFGDIAAGSIDGLGGFVGGVAGSPIPAELRVNGTLIPSSEPLPGAMVWLRPGTQDQPPMPAPFAGVRRTTSLNVELNRGQSHLYTFEGDDEISELTFVFAFPAGLYQQGPTGAVTGYGALFRVFWRPQGAAAFTPLTNATIPIQATAYYGLHVFTHRVPISATGPIEIAVTNSGFGGSTQGVVDNAVWRDIVVTSPHVLRYPREALMALEIAAGARFSGGLPQISLRCDCMLVRVWDATNGWSPRCWDVPPAPHDFNTYPPGRNPAWVLLDFLLGRHGLGRWITEDRVDLPAFRRWAAFCDQDPNPGDPWGEAAFCVDVVGDVVRPAWEWVLLFCSAGRATPVMRNGKISVVYQYRDAHSDGGITVPAKEPLQLLTSGNCEDVSVKLMPKRNRATVFEFQFLNEEAAYAQDVFPVEDDEATFQNPTALQRDQVRVEAIQAWGVTRESQLFREGRWRHRVGRLVDWELSGRTGPWALAAEVGDLFDFEHDLLRPFGTDVPLTMQVLAVDLAFGTVTVDHHMAGTGLQIVVRDSEGKPVRRNVTSYANATVAGRKQSVLTLASAADVEAGAAGVVGLVDKLTQTYELVSIGLAKSLHREFRAVQWTPEAYDPITREDFLGTDLAQIPRVLAAVVEPSTADTRP